MTDDLESYWNKLRHKETPIVKLDGRSKLDAIFETTTEKVQFDLNNWMTATMHEADVTQSVTWARVISKGIELYFRKWYETCKEQTLATTFELILTRMTPQEMTEFLHNIPYRTLHRMTEEGSDISYATGVHALMALEDSRRRTESPHYTIDTYGDRIRVTFLVRQSDEEVQFFLDEQFKI